MSKIIVVILFTFIVICVGFEQEQRSDSEPELNDKSDEDSDEDKYELESRQDFDKTSEKEKEFKILRKAKRLKEDNYRRALESMLPAKDSNGYRKFFEELINNSDENSRRDEPDKAVEDVVVSDTFVDGEPTDDNNDDDPQVEEIEVVIEHFSDGDNDTSTTEAQESFTESVTVPSNIEPPRTEPPKTEPPKTEPKKAKPPPVTSTNNQSKPKSSTAKPKPVVEHKSRSGMDTSRSVESMDSLQMARLEERRLMEPYPVSRFSEVVIPHYRTTLTRNGVMVSPAVYTVQTSSPMIDHVTNRNWIPGRAIGPEYYGRSGSNKITHRETDARFIDDYNDYGSNAYSYSPSKSQMSSRQGESKIDILSKIAEASYQPTLGNLKPFRENLYPGAYYQQPQRYYQDSYRPMFRIRR